MPATVHRWRARRTALALLALLAALGGCAAPVAREPGETLLSGRLSLRVDSQPPRSLSTAFELSGDAASGRLRLTTPLGTVAAQAQWSPQRVTLTTADGSTDYPNLDALAVEALGEPLPIAALFDWLRGRAWTGAPSQPRRDGAPGFEQLGWTVATAHLAEGWIEAQRTAPPAVSVRARLDGSQTP